MDVLTYRTMRDMLVSYNYTSIVHDSDLTTLNIFCISYGVI